MYDCQTDTCTDFSFAFFDAVECTRPLVGTLTATPVSVADTISLSALSDFADKLGYQAQHSGTIVVVPAVNLPDALAINAHFGKQLVISCDLRREPPVRFG